MYAKAHFTIIAGIILIVYLIAWLLGSSMNTPNELHYRIVKDSVNYTIYNEDGKLVMIFKEGDIPQLDSIFIKDNL